MTNLLEKFCSNQKFKKQRLQDEDKKTCLDLNQVLNFIESKTKKNQSQAMKTAFNLAKDNGMRPIWITEEQALKLNKEIKYNVFIIESFKTELFDILYKNKNCSIYGPSTIFYCKNQLNLPRRQYPIFNLCMRNLEICIDKHFEQDEIAKFFGLINFMSGKFSLKLKPTCTHLISDSHLTEKSKTARMYGIPIMRSEWIQECWNISLSKELNADDKIIMDKFRLPVFHGFHVSSTQVEWEVKEKVRKLVSRNGGEFNGGFHPKKVTHLVIGGPTGEKYEVAKKRGIHLVKEEWVIESVKHGYPLIEYDYLIEKVSNPPKKFDFEPYVHLLTQSTSLISKPMHNSQIVSQVNSQIQTQKRTQANSEINTQYKTQPETQADIEPDQIASNSQQSLISSKIVSPSQGIISSQKDSTKQQSPPQTQENSNKPQVQNPAKTYCVKSKAEIEKSKNLNAFSVLTSSQNRQPKASKNLEDELDKLVTRLDNNCKSSIFDGCDFYIYDDFPQNIKINLRRCITLQNGFVSGNLRKSVSHVIVKDVISDIERKKLDQELHKFDHDVNQVNLKWIIECSKSNKLLPSFNLNNLSVSLSQPTHLNQQEISNSYKQSINQRRTRPNRNSSIYSQPVSQSKRVTEDDNDDIFNDYCDFGQSQQENQEIPPLRSQKNSYFNSQSTVTAPSETSLANFDDFDDFNSDLPQSLSQTMQNKLANLKTMLNSNDQATKSKTTLTTATTATTTKTSTKTVSSSVSTIKRNESKKEELSSIKILSAESTATMTTSRKEVLETSVSTSANTTITNLNQLQIEILDEENQQYTKKDDLIPPSVPIAWNDQRQNQGGNDRSFSLPTNLDAYNPTQGESVYTDEKMRSHSDDSCIRNRLIEKRPVESFQVFQDESTEIQLPPVKKNKPCKFSFIGYSPQEKNRFAEQLAKLKIILNENNDLDYEYLVTHETKFIKNELFFVSVATGKWICHPDFYKKTLELGRVPDPLQYEWGSNEKYLNTLDNKYVLLAKSCRYWREKVSRTGKFAFENQYLAIVSVRANQFSSIITNGGGRVFPIELKDDTKESYQIALTDLYQKLKSGTYSKFTYVLVNFKKKDQDKLDIVNLVKPIDQLNYLCLSIDYLSLFLVWDSKMKLNNCRIDKQQSPNLKRSLNNSDDVNKQSKMVRR